MKKVLIGLLLVLSLGGCSTISGYFGATSPAQAVYVAKTDYAAALTAAVAYKELPLCSTAILPPCSEEKVVNKLRSAATVADKALDSAEEAVRTPGFGKDVVDSAIVSAKAAVKALVAITATLKGE